MCTLYTFDRSIESQMLSQIAIDSRLNDDGYSVCLTRGTDIVFRGQFIELKDFLRVWMVVDYDRAFVHLRASTTSTQGIPGCHMFNDPSHRYIYCHNGIIQAGNDAGYPVDSQWLGEFLQNDQVPDCTEYYEDFANFIVLDAYKGKFAGYAVHRTGNLYTDGLGNYSTTRPANHWKYANHGWTQYGTELIEVVPDEDTAKELKARHSKRYAGLIGRNYTQAWDMDDQSWSYRPGKIVDKILPSHVYTPHPDSPPFDVQDETPVEPDHFTCEGCNEECAASEKAGIPGFEICNRCNALWYPDLKEWADREDIAEFLTGDGE